ncbi:MAG: type IV toxin-antitoxin system AbiEi family antitoxin domain-containing protein [Candidatus Diapherotrites archaeon]
MKYIKGFREHFSKQPVFSIRDVRVFLKRQGISRQYVHTLLNHLLKRKELNRITRGIYTFRGDPAVLSFAYRPSYHCLQDALSLRNLWEQETNAILITPRKVRTGVREFFGAKAIIRRVNRRMFFGYDSVKHYDLWIPVSDIEKTLIDFAYFNEPLDGKTLQAIKRKIDRKKMRAYLKRVPQRTRMRVALLLGNAKCGRGR